MLMRTSTETLHMYVPAEPFEDNSVVLSRSFYGLLFLSYYHLSPSPGFFPMSVNTCFCKKLKEYLVYHLT
jgi:hypothetical protein